MRILIVGANNSGIRSLIMNRLEGNCDVIEFLGDNVEINDIEDHYIPAVLSDVKKNNARAVAVPMLKQG